MWFNKKERTYQEIIDEIHSNLGENKKENIKYLKEQAEKYKKHSMAHEILKEKGFDLFLFFVFFRKTKGSS